MHQVNLLETHFNIVAKAIREGRVIPFFGAGVNLCNRGGKAWDRSQQVYLPSAAELTQHLSDRYFYPKDEAQELGRVSQYVDIMHGLGALYEELHDLFDNNYPTTDLHQFFASLPSILSEKNYPAPKLPWRQRLVIMTTNYDDLMERAFEDAGVKYHVLTYVADLKEREGEAGKFLHWTPERKSTPVVISDEYEALEDDKFPVIIKIHGNVDRLTIREIKEEPLKHDSYVITEDHYIDYLTHLDILKVLPPSIATIIQRSSFLFLGYSLRDWNFRVILRRIWRERPLGFPAWAILKDPTEFDENYWRRRDVVMVDMELARYVEGLRKYV